MSYEQNEWVTDWDDANAPADEQPQWIEDRDKAKDELDAALERYYEREQAIRNAHTSWRKTMIVLDAMVPEWRGAHDPR